MENNKGTTGPANTPEPQIQQLAIKPPAEQKSLLHRWLEGKIKRRYLFLGLALIVVGAAAFVAVRLHGGNDYVLTDSSGQTVNVSQSDMQKYLDQQMRVPTPKELLAFDKDKVNGLVPAAKKQLAGKLAAYSDPYSDKIEHSSVNLCYYSSNYAGFSTTGFTKSCYLRSTDLFPLKEATYSAAIANFEGIYRPNQDSSQALPFNEGPCTQYLMSNDEDPHAGEFYFCPAGTSFESIEEYFDVYPGESIGSNMAYQVRGSLDEADIDGLLNVNYAIVEKDFYDMRQAINSANQKSKAGFVIIGVTHRYYDEAMDKLQ